MNPTTNRPVLWFFDRPPICQSCNRKLDDVDNSEHIDGHKKQIDILKGEVTSLGLKIKDIDEELEILNKTKLLIDDKNKLELGKDRLEVEIGGLRNTVGSKINDLKKYKLNLEAIELNKKVDSEIENVKTNLVVANKTKDETIKNIEI